MTALSMIHILHSLIPLKFFHPTPFDVMVRPVVMVSVNYLMSQSVSSSKSTYSLSNMTEARYVKIWVHKKCCIVLLSMMAANHSSLLRKIYVKNCLSPFPPLISENEIFDSIQTLLSMAQSNTNQYQPFSRFGDINHMMIHLEQIFHTPIAKSIVLQSTICPETP